MTTFLTGVLVRGPCFWRPVLEHFMSEPFLSIVRFSRKIRLETPKIAVYREEQLEKRLVRNGWPTATTHSADHSTKLGSSV